MAQSENPHLKWRFEKLPLPKKITKEEFENLSPKIKGITAYQSQFIKEIKAIFPVNHEEDLFDLLSLVELLESSLLQLETLSSIVATPPPITGVLVIKRVIKLKIACLTEMAGKEAFDLRTPE